MKLFPAPSITRLLAACACAWLGFADENPNPSQPRAPLESGSVGEPFFPHKEPLREFSRPLGSIALLNDLIFYDHGDPTDHEQYMLELVNRARADPGAEAARLNIDLNEGLPPGSISNTLKQPLGFHPALIAAARGHSQWMLDTDTFSHTGANGSNPSQRAQAAGYPSGAGENIAWGGTSGAVNPSSSTLERHNGLFISPGHRLNICNASYREIGLGILEGQFLDNGTNWNALMATQKFGSSPLTPGPFLVGVAYYDLNGNGYYDPGEGIEGLQISLASASYFTLTASAGGYTLPRPSSAGTRAVTFSSSGYEQSFLMEMPASTNLKVDLALPYSPPVLSGPTQPLAGLANSYTVSPVPGATAFDIAVLASNPTLPDDANDLARVADSTSASYSALSTSVAYEGTGSYRFAHPETVDQTLAYNESFIPGPAASVSFRSRLGWAAVGQSARVEVSADGGLSWNHVYLQNGTGNAGEANFAARSASLADFAGKQIRLRFNYRHTGGSYYPQTSNGFGWYVDAIEFSDIETLSVVQETTIEPGEAFLFTPASEGPASLLVQPRNLDRHWPAGSALQVTSVASVAGYFSWAQAWESSGGLAAGELASTPYEDFSGDGIANLLAYAMALDPLASSVLGLPGWVNSDRGRAFEYLADTAALGVELRPELSTDLASWHPPGAAALGFSSEAELVGTAGSMERRRIVFPEGLPPFVAARLSVKIAP